MITRSCLSFLVGLSLLASPTALIQAEEADDTEPVANVANQAARQKIDRRSRARVRALAALAALALLGLALVAATWIGGRMTRRYMKSGEKALIRPVDPVFTDDWASKPLTPQERERLDSSEW